MGGLPYPSALAHAAAGAEEAGAAGAAVPAVDDFDGAGMDFQDDIEVPRAEESAAGASAAEEVRPYSCVGGLPALVPDPSSPRLTRRPPRKRGCADCSPRQSPRRPPQRASGHGGGGRGGREGGSGRDWRRGLLLHRRRATGARNGPPSPGACVRAGEGVSPHARPHSLPSPPATSLWRRRPGGPRPRAGACTATRPKSCSTWTRPSSRRKGCGDAPRAVPPSPSALTQHGGWVVAQDSVSFQRSLGRGVNRANASRAFLQLLVLKTRRALDVKQDEPFGHIFVSRGVRGAPLRRLRYCAPLIPAAAAPRTTSSTCEPWPPTCEGRSPAPA